MRRWIIPCLLAAACANSPSSSSTSSSGDHSGADAAVSQDDAGTGGADAGFELPANPSLDELARYWDPLACRLYACTHRLRDTPEACSHAATSNEWPFNTFRLAQASVAAGRATYNQANGNACGALLKSMDLSQECFGQFVQSFKDRYGNNFKTSCEALVTGTVAPGGNCDSSSECDQDGACVFDREPDCQGICVVWLQAGASCVDAPRDCAPDTYCDGMVCQARELQENGTFCAQDSVCRSGKCFDYACTDRSPEGGECVEDEDCGALLYCRPLPPSTGRLGICERPAVTGAPCGYAIQCAGNQSCAGYSQRYNGGNVNGACQARPSNVGEPCVNIAEGYDYGDTGCFMDLTCNPTSTTCEEAPAIGSPCAMPGNRCGYKAYCDDGGTCRAQKAAGQTATHVRECRDGAFSSFEMVCEDPSVWERCYGME